ncbi:hypothetical protein ACVW0Q_002291 [Thermostichus sp. MS-CIW-21]|nr:hypothetical protein CYA_2380 [Synechococcus sp. JA-3-3Ab]
MRRAFGGQGLPVCLSLSLAGIPGQEGCRVRVQQR